MYFLLHVLCFYEQLKAALEREKAKAKAAEKAAGGGGGKERAKSPGKGKGGGKKTPEPQQAKEGSKLKKRGEEDPEGKYIGIKFVVIAFLNHTCVCQFAQACSNFKCL
jgi:hypothetical protein